MNQSTGKFIIVIGVVVILAGIIIYFFGNKLGFIGRLPGDIRIEGENSGFYFPITTCILFSLIITGIIKLIQWFLR
jgi:hypothetical protein